VLALTIALGVLRPRIANGTATFPYFAGVRFITCSPYASLVRGQRHAAAKPAGHFLNSPNLKLDQTTAINRD
jgi:hypothetical protein